MVKQQWYLFLQGKGPSGVILKELIAKSTL
jgi:hypothetical protein